MQLGAVQGKWISVVNYNNGRQLWRNSGSKVFPMMFLSIYLRKLSFWFTII